MTSTGLGSIPTGRTNLVTSRDRGGVPALDLAVQDRVRVALGQGQPVPVVVVGVAVPEQGQPGAGAHVHDPDRPAVVELLLERGEGGQKDGTAVDLVGLDGPGGDDPPDPSGVAAAEVRQQVGGAVFGQVLVAGEVGGERVLDAAAQDVVDGREQHVRGGLSRLGAGREVEQLGGAGGRAGQGGVQRGQARGLLVGEPPEGLGELGAVGHRDHLR
nr:hypothetical protein [Streptomyces kasugaensis]